MNEESARKYPAGSVPGSRSGEGVHAHFCRATFARAYAALSEKEKSLDHMLQRFGQDQGVGRFPWFSLHGAICCPGAFRDELKSIFSAIGFGEYGLEAIKAIDQVPPGLPLRSSFYFSMATYIFYSSS